MAGPFGCVRSNQCESVVERAKVFSRQFCAGIENRQGPQWLVGVLRHNRLCPRFSIVTIILARASTRQYVLYLYGTQLYPHCTPTLQYVSPLSRVMGCPDRWYNNRDCCGSDWKTANQRNDASPSEAISRARSALDITKALSAESI